jgi:hypothetical protein
MPKRINPQDQWETDFQVPLPGEPRNIGPLEILFQKLLNRTERLKNRIAAILGTAWDATPPDTLAGLAGRVSTLESGQGGTNLSAHRTAPVLDHPDGSVTAEKLAPVRNAPTITPSPGSWLLGGLASGTGVGKIPLGQGNGVPLLNANGALASSDAYLNRGTPPTPTDWNSITEAGIYIIDGYNFGAGSANTPPTTFTYGQLWVLKSVPNPTTQIYIPYTNDARIYWRQLWGTNWSTWATLNPVYASNSNGEFIRFSDGLQICWASHDPTSFGAENTGIDPNYKYRLKTWVYPAAFIAPPIVLASGDISGFGADIAVAYSASMTQCILEAGRYGTGAASVHSFYSLAIGRWK